MPYFSANQLRESVGVLKQLNTFLISLLAMFKARIPTAATSAGAVNFGSQNENALLGEYFRIPGLPPATPYFTAFGRDQGSFVDPLYAGRTLQRLRKDADATGGIFWHPDAKRWAFRPAFAQTLSTGTRFQLREVSVSALAVWCYRKKDVASVAQAVDDFIAEFGIDRDGLLGSSFHRDVGRFSDADLRAEPLDDATIAEILGVTPPAVDPPDRQDFEGRLSDELSRRNIEFTSDLLQAIIVAWLSGDIVVLVGSPGTGKSTIAHGLAAALGVALGSDDSVASVTVQVTSETDLSAMLGYQNLEGAFVPSAFSATLLMDQDNQLRACVAVLDEFNLANVDAYLAPVLAAIESRKEIVLSPGSGHGGSGAVTRALPVDTLILATCNSFIEEPETRLPLSRPVKRRCTILHVPNLLAERAASHGVPNTFSEVGSRQILRELEEVSDRIDVGSGTSFDRYRSEMLHNCSRYADLDDEVRRLLEAVGAAFLATPAGRRFFTIGVFRDILLSVVMTPPDRRVAAISQQFVSKMVHIYSGSLEGLKAAAEPLRGKQGYEAIDELLRDLADRAGAIGVVMPLV